MPLSKNITKNVPEFNRVVRNRYSLQPQIPISEPRNQIYYFTQQIPLHLPTDARRLERRNGYQRRELQQQPLLDNAPAVGFSSHLRDQTHRRPLLACSPSCRQSSRARDDQSYGRFLQGDLLAQWDY
ncbi:hypothetical protein LINGRAPRIM_LOCUS3315 [Linum grandiflorum]